MGGSSRIPALSHKGSSRTSSAQRCLGPGNALAAYAMLGSGAFLPIHWGTFNLAVHPWDEPIETVPRRAPSLGVPLVTPKFGESLEPARANTPDP
jgi:L-ascorbate metabolism protein UlaG (beta-lactamase superfamily)